MLWVVKDCRWKAVKRDKVRELFRARVFHDKGIDHISLGKDPVVQFFQSKNGSHDEFL